MIYFHETMGDIKDYDIIEAFYDRIDHARVIIFESIQRTDFCEVVFIILRLKKFKETHGVFSWNLG